MSLNLQAILDATVSHALASGYFERVNQHEPKAAPGNGISAAVWVNTIGPAVGASGLTATSGRLELNVRVMQNMLKEPQDAIEPAVLAAVDALMSAYSGDFDLGGNVRNVDLLGQAGVPLSAQAGYLPIDGKLYRAMTIVLPLIINDLWNQGA